MIMALLFLLMCGLLLFALLLLLMMCDLLLRVASSRIRVGLRVCALHRGHASHDVSSVRCTPPKESSEQPLMMEQPLVLPALG